MRGTAVKPQFLPSERIAEGQLVHLLGPPPACPAITFITNATEDIYFIWRRQTAVGCVVAMVSWGVARTATSWDGLRLFRRVVKCAAAIWDPFFCNIDLEQVMSEVFRDVRSCAAHI